MLFNNSRYNITCCKDCPDRQADPNCHGFCEKYLQQKKVYEEQMAEARKKADIARGLTEQQFDSAERVNRYRNYRSKYRGAR